MLGLVLEGGGARGAYQAGAIRTLLTQGYKFDGVTGTSIGALNAVMLAQGRFDESYELWETIEFSTLFDLENKYASNFAAFKFDKETIKYSINKIKEIIANKGLDTSRIKKLLIKYIDEDKLRGSSMDFGLLTVSINEMKPYEIFKEDIPYGMVADYVMASSNFPGFNKMTIGDKTFVDGGLYDNMPINMLVGKGYKDIIAIETKSFIPKRKCKDPAVQVLHIKPSEKPGRMLDFRLISVGRAMKLGKFDMLRYLKGYFGEIYFLKVTTESPFGYGLMDMPQIAYQEIGEVLGLGKNFINYELLNVLNKFTKSNHLNVADCLLYILEKIAEQLKIERLEIYSITDFISLIKEKLTECETIEKSHGKKVQEINIFELIYKYYFGD